jgi:hypothetical protein
MEPKDLRIPNGKLEAVNRRRTDNTMITIRKINRHTIVEKHDTDNQRMSNRNPFKNRV